MTEAGKYRALPVKLESSSVEAIDTLLGAMPLDGILVDEVREVSGGELMFGLVPEAGVIRVGELEVTAAQLWLYGTRRIEVEASGSFLERPQPIIQLSLEPDVVVEFGAGKVTGVASHAVLRVSVAETF